MEFSETERSRPSYRWLLWLLIPLGIGLLLSLLIRQPSIGVIYLDSQASLTDGPQEENG